MNKESMLRELDIFIADEERDKEYIKQFNDPKDKVFYLLMLKKYKQNKAADMIGITPRHVRRIVRQIKQEMT